MCFLAVPVLVFAAVCQAADAPSASSVAEKFRTIVGNFDRELLALDPRAGAQVKMALAARRNAQFEKLLNENREPALETLSTADLVALAICSEHLRRRDEALRFAQLAFERSPDDATVYPPLVRTLLNLNRTEEAGRVMDSVWDRFPHSDDVQSLNLFVYLKYNSLGSKNEALHHITRLFKYYEAAIERVPLTAAWAAQNTESFAVAFESCEQAEQLAAELKRLCGVVDRRIAAVDLNPPSSTPSIIAPRCALRKFRCELSRFLDPPSAIQSQIDWLDELIPFAVEEPANGAVISQLHPAMLYSLEHAYLWDHAMLARAEHWTRSAAIDSPDAEAPRPQDILHKHLVEFERRIRRQVTLAEQLVGTTVPLSEKVDWLTNPPESNCVALVLLWNPKRPIDFLGLDDLQSVQSRISSQQFSIIAMSRYVGLQWDEDRSRLVRADVMDPAVEREALAKALKRRESGFPCALIQDGSKLAEWYGTEDEHVHLLFDAEQRVVRVSTSTTDAGLRYLEREARNLLTSKTPH